MRRYRRSRFRPMRSDLGWRPLSALYPDVILTNCLNSLITFDASSEPFVSLSKIVSLVIAYSAAWRVGYGPTSMHSRVLKYHAPLL